MNRQVVALVATVAILFASQPVMVMAQGSAAAIVRYKALNHPVYDPEGIVASQVELSSQIGARILAQGGNAIDAAVAVGFSLAVTLPRAGNLGGGGFMLVYLAEEDRTIAIDYREKAPVKASRDMYLNAEGVVDQRKVRFSHMAAGVPGTVAGFWEAHSKYGVLPWKDVVMPAVELARDGIVVSYDLANNLARRRDRLVTNAATRKYYFKAGAVPYQPGERLVQTDLATTLLQIAEGGKAAFYEGPIAEKIAAEMQKNGGIVDMESLAAYRPAVREPLVGSYRGYGIVTMPPASSGGVHIIQMLNIMESFPVAAMGPGSADSLHLLTEVAKLAYADRTAHLGDTDFYDVPMDWLTSKDYARTLAAGIDMNKARPSDDILPGVSPLKESFDTTHFSVMDSYGNAVSNTYTLNFSYGSGISVAGAGFLLNNEMDDFSAKVGVPNAYGLMGTEANAVSAGKRPLSSMTPVMVFNDGKPFFTTGSPGGSRIITTVLQMVVNVLDHGMNLADACHAPRMHHQWYPDILLLESGFSPDTTAELERRGHVLRMTGAMGSLQSVGIRDGLLRGASDPRRPSAGVAGAADVPQ